MKVRNGSEFKLGDVFSYDDLQIQILEKVGDTIRLDRAVSRGEASRMYLEKVEVQPEIWTEHFVEAWEQYWNRDDDHGISEEMQRYVNMVPQLPGFQLEPITGEVLYDAIRGLKLLADIFCAIEEGARWPAALTQWFLVLLRKTDDPVATWDQIRPISVSAALYRLWARLRAKEMLKVFSCRSTGMIKPNLPTTAIWGMLSDFLDWSADSGAKPAGIVFDIVKAFNSLHRPLLGELPAKTGTPRWLWQCWQQALQRMVRGFRLLGSTIRLACLGQEFRKGIRCRCAVCGRIRSSLDRL